MPVIIDLETLTKTEQSIDIASVKSVLASQTLVPVAVRNGNDPLHEAAIASGLGILNASHNKIPDTSESTTSKTDEPEQPEPKTLIIDKPIRSGQQVCSPNGDLVVLASVSHGAELLAAGSIHVYGALRGRALAGISGDTTARIFCRRLEAELVSIAGHYLLRDQLPIDDTETGCQLFLDEEAIKIASI